MYNTVKRISERECGTLYCTINKHVMLEKNTGPFMSSEKDWIFLSTLYQS